MSQRFRIPVLIAMLSLALPASAVSETVVVQWNDAALEAVRATRMPPMRVARALAIAHTCMFDAWAAYDPVAIPVRPDSPARRPAYEQTPAARDAAISYAAYRCLSDLFPSESARFARLMISLGYDPSDDSTDVSTPAGVGNAAGAVEVEWCHRDGANQLGDLTPSGVPYADYTGYEPANSPWSVSDPNRWQPLANADGTSQQFLAAHWGLLAPFALTSASQFRPSAPPLYPHGTYAREALEVAHMSGQLGDREKAIALYWADGPQTETPPGHWNLFARWVSARDGPRHRS